jgi:glycosyltransferase involved in cell wall biosynthesis
MEQPLVSVCVLTYNHEKYIEQALDSIFSQTLIARCEVIIGEDNSNDGTRDVVMRYAHRSNVRLLLTDDNNRKIYANGKMTGRRNLFDCLAVARGRYLIILEGDDYWIDNGKLAKQVALMEANEDCTLCFHDNFKEFEDGSRTGYGNFKADIQMLDEHIVLRDVVPHTRNIFTLDWPEVMTQAAYGDWPLFLYALGRGRSCYINEKMSVYRIHGQGAWSGRQTGSYQAPLDHLFIFRRADQLLGKRFMLFKSKVYWRRWRLKARAVRLAIMAGAYNDLGRILTT